MVERKTRLRGAQVLAKSIEASDLSGVGETTGFVATVQADETIAYNAPGGGGGGSTFKQTFVTGDLTSDKITITHNLGTAHPGIIVYNNLDNVILPTEVTYLTDDTIELDFTGVAPLTGTYKVRIFGTSSGTGGGITLIQDDDTDTRIETEKNADEDIIRFTVLDTQEAQLDVNGLTLKTGASINEFSTDGTLSGNSDDAVPTEKAVKTYIDNEVANSALVVINQQNIVLNAFRIAINGSLTQFSMVDGIVDEYEDESGIDTANSINESFDSILDLYSPSGGLPGEEYTSDSFTKLLLHMNGADASTTFTDDGDTGHTVTANGNAQIDTAESIFGGASGLFDGAGDYLSIPDSDDWNFGAGLVTIDFRIRFNTLPAISEITPIVSQEDDNNNRWQIFVQKSGGGSIFWGLRIISGGVGIAFSSKNFDININEWHHIAFVRDTSTTMKVYIDGVNIGTDLNLVGDFPNLTSNLEIGRGAGDPTNSIDGWIDELRISKGIARFTTNFDTPLNMTLISNTFTAEAQPDNARIVIFEEDIDSVTLNTDLKAFTSRDSGQTFTSDFSTDDKLDITSHGFSNDDRIMVTSSSQDLPAGLTSDIIYYIINATTNDFELSLTSGGSAVDITDDGTGTHTAKQVSEITLINEGEYESGRNIISASVDISGQASGTSMEYIIQTLNEKNLNIHGVGLSWD